MSVVPPSTAIVTSVVAGHLRSRNSPTKCWRRDVQGGEDGVCFFSFLLYWFMPVCMVVAKVTPSGPATTRLWLLCVREASCSTPMASMCVVNQFTDRCNHSGPSLHPWPTGPSSWIRGEITPYVGGEGEQPLLSSVSPSGPEVLLPVQSLAQPALSNPGVYVGRREGGGFSLATRLFYRHIHHHYYLQPYRALTTHTPSLTHGRKAYGLGHGVYLGGDLNQEYVGKIKSARSRLILIDVFRFGGSMLWLCFETKYLSSWATHICYRSLCVLSNFPHKFAMCILQKGILNGVRTAGSSNCHLSMHVVVCVCARVRYFARIICRNRVCCSSLS